MRKFTACWIPNPAPSVVLVEHGDDLELPIFWDTWLQHDHILQAMENNHLELYICGIFNECVDDRLVTVASGAHFT